MTVVSASARDLPYSLRCFTPDRRQAQASSERSLSESASPESLRRYHDLLASEPHVAGSPGDFRVIESIAREFEHAGLDVHVHWIWPYLPRPLAAELEIISPERLSLELAEPPIDADPDTAHPALTFGFNAYSGSGEAVGEVVYGNYGRKEDFERLRALGVDCTGRVVIARYGGNYRGFKAKYAEEAGAAGLIIYTDPADSGYMRGLMYPEGGWATDRQIQRGSLSTLGYSGDPLTPGVEAAEHAPRLDPDSVALPRIPVQPIGWGAARQIMEKMRGPGVPEEAWQGALPFPYRLTGGPDLRLRLKVEQERAITKTANVIGTLRGSDFPDELIVVGCHHDAWGFGAADPTAGTHVLLEAARLFGEAAKRGDRPRRTVIFAAWAAEEHGIIGSSEWVEANLDRLRAGGVAYINLDMAAMGPLFNASGSPTLATLIADATRIVPQARDPGRTVFAEWTSRKAAMDAPVEDAARLVGTMGGGSDHVGFYFHACVPSASVGGGGSRGTSYHSNYDTLRWYRLVVGDDYEPSLMVVRVLAAVISRLASADLLPLDPAGIAPALTKHLDDLEKRCAKAKVDVDLAGLREAVRTLSDQSQRWRGEVISRFEAGEMSPAELARANAMLMRLERAWTVESGLPGREWHKNAFMSPDETSGYSAWPLPLLRQAVETGDAAALRSAADDLRERVERIGRTLESGGGPPERFP